MYKLQSIKEDNEQSIEEPINEKKQPVSKIYINKKYIDDTKIDLWTNKIVFKMVMKTIDIDRKFNLNNELLEYVNNHRIEYINKLINAKYKDIISKPDDVSRDLYICVNEAWTEQFITSLDSIEISDRIELMNAKVYKFFNYRIIIKDTEESIDQAAVDFLGLCWLYFAEKNIAPGIECDAIVSLKGFRMFFCALVGIEFYNELVKYPLMYSFYSEYKPFELQDIKIISNEFKMVMYPLKETMIQFPKACIEHYARWERVPYFKF